MRAYSELYLTDTQSNMGEMFDWAVNARRIELGHFMELFIGSGLAERFGNGDPSVTCGRSGVELGMMVLGAAGEQGTQAADQALLSRSPEYWTGWVYAYYQWSTAIPIEQLNRLVPAVKVMELYNPYHEMGIRQVCDRLDRMVACAQRCTNLKAARERAGMSQGELSMLSGVSLRTIQHYEQRSKDINKASWETVWALSRALHLRPEELTEPLSRDRYEYAMVKV